MLACLLLQLRGYIQLSPKLLHLFDPYQPRTETLQSIWCIINTPLGRRPLSTLLLRTQALTIVPSPLCALAKAMRTMSLSLTVAMLLVVAGHVAQPAWGDASLGNSTMPVVEDSRSRRSSPGRRRWRPATASCGGPATTCLRALDPDIIKYVGYDRSSSTCILSIPLCIALFACGRELLSTTRALYLIT